MDVPVKVALVQVLTAWRRHAGAVTLVLVGYGAATYVGTPMAYYAAALVAFCTWMAWFVSTGAEFLRVLGV